MNLILPTVETKTALRARMSGYASDGCTTALVPTMGALHAGHLSLIKIAKRHADKVIVSIFVNPAQFSPGEDFEAYPRDIDADMALLAHEDIDLIYLPATDAMYFDDHSTQVIVGDVGEGLETDHRPTFFHGVALVVNKLLNQVRPDVAIFGEKDYQQLAVIRRMVRDLDMPTEIIGAPIARDSRGLALSSRNRYFDAEGLDLARNLNRVLFAARDQLQGGANISDTLLNAHKNLLDAGFSNIDYVSLADATTLNLKTDGQVTAPMRLLMATHCRGVRLIDNCAVNPVTAQESP
ncbi:MAG: pantoate--beta-alanine ligase [Litorimonas sp.]